MAADKGIDMCIGKFYKKAMAHIRTALKAICDAGGAFQLRAFVWFQVRCCVRAHVRARVHV